MKRKILASVLALCMVLALIPAVSAAQSGSCGESVTWVLENGTLTISGTGRMEEYSDNVNFASPWYPQAASIQKVVVSQGVTYIGSYAFYGCTNLTSVSIADSVTSIDYGAFEDCASLAYIDIPNSVTHICVSVFSGCDSLTEITIPASVTGICESPFWDTDNLTAIHVAANNPAYCSDRGVLLSKDKTYLIQCPRAYAGDYDIPESVTTIWDEAFSSCGKLTGITIPRTVTIPQIPSAEIPSFEDCAALSSVTLPENLTRIPNITFYFCEALEQITIPQSVTDIGPNAFCFAGLTSVTIPAGVTRLGVEAFSCCPLTEVFFEGDAPEVYDNYNAVDNRKAISYVWDTVAYYHADNPTWTEAARSAVSTEVTWVAYDPNNPFLDVPYGSWYYAPVVWAVEHSITNGLTDTAFGPTSNCNRAQVVTFLWRAAGSPEPAATTHSFVDVQAGSFYEKAVLWAVENGITTGTDATHFSPNAVCNRATVVTFIWRAKDNPAPASTNNPFTDVAAGSWYGNAVLWAVENNITNGLTDTTFGPTTNCNRAQVVTFLYRAYAE